MSEVKIGPWYAVQPPEASGWWVVSTDPEGCDCVDESGDGGFEEKTARLIAAAPELLEALEVIAEPIDFASCVGDPWAFYCDLQNVARAAIAKAKGE